VRKAHLNVHLIVTHFRVFTIQTDRQTMLVYFTWPTKRPGGHQNKLTIYLVKLLAISVTRDLAHVCISISLFHRVKKLLLLQMYAFCICNVFNPFNKNVNSSFRISFS